jgi:hypothetical protein
MRHIYEDQSGVVLCIEYDSSLAPVTYKGIHVVGADYVPVGPDIREFLGNVWCMWGTQGLTRPLLTEIAEEIMNEPKRTE